MAFVRAYGWVIVHKTVALCSHTFVAHMCMAHMFTAEDTVRIAHVRQEFIMDMSTGATADTMSWELAAMLSKDLETVTAASLRITEVDAKTDKGRLIRDSLAGGDLIVA